MSFSKQQHRFVQPDFATIPRKVLNYLRAQMRVHCEGNQQILEQKLREIDLKKQGPLIKSTTPRKNFGDKRQY